MVRRFLYDQLYPNSVIPSEDVLEDSYPEIEEKIHVFNSAVATSDEHGSPPGKFEATRTRTRPKPDP